MLGHARYAGFWLRAVAALVDLMVLGVVLAVFVSFLAVAKAFRWLFWSFTRESRLAPFLLRLVHLAYVRFCFFFW